MSSVSPSQADTCLISASDWLYTGVSFLPASSEISSVSDTSGNGKSDSRGKSRSTPKLTNRSRSGCQTCKRRRQKCDEVKPACSRCIGLGVKCHYQVALSFRDDYEKRGQSFGREGVWSRKGAQSNNSNSLMKKLSGAKFQEIQNRHSLNFINYKMAQYKLSLRQLYQLNLPILNPCTELPDQSDSVFALNYYLDYILPILNPVGFSSRGSKLYLENTIVELEPGLETSTMIQYLQQYPHLFQMMLALGAMYLSKLDNSSYDWHAKSREFRREGMKAIENLFLTKIGGDVKYTTDQILSLVLLMFYELAEEHNENWADYLHASGRLFFSESFVQPQSDVERALLKFSLELLNYQETMGRTACKAKSNFFIAPDESESHLTPSAQTSHQVVQVSWMGCDKDLILIISDITELSFERLSPDMTEDRYLSKSSNMQLKLSSMQLSGLSLEMQQEIDGRGKESEFVPMNIEVADVGSNVEVICYLLACEAKRMATVIYLECSLLNKTPSNPEIQALVMKVYRILEFIVIQHSFKWSSTLLWTIFVAGSEIATDTPVSEQLRYLTLEILNRLERRSLGNVSTTIELVVGIWKNRDLGETSKKNFKREGAVIGFKNDWDIYVADESYKVSLA